MTRSLSSNRLRLRFFLLFFLLATALGPHTAFSANEGAINHAPTGQIEQHISTHYFSVSYPQGEEKAANWYAGFVDDVDISVSELLGAQPVEGLKLTIYATEAEYTQANP